MNGWMGKILRINLGNSEIKEIPVQPYAEKYLGGRGIASRLYWELVPPVVKPFDPQNVLIFMTGPLVATGAQAATRLSIVSKSPMALPEGFCYGNVGGFFGPELKKAGYDGIIIEGQAPQPVQININNGRVEIRDASSLWGLNVDKVKEIIGREYGKNTRFLTTGISGEKRVRLAALVGSHESASSAGFGAVMASKNLKVITVRGTGKPAVADLELLRKLNRYAVHISQRARFSIPPGVEATRHQHLLTVIGLGGCYQCGLECIRGLYRYSHGATGYRKCQSQEYYLPWLYGKEDEPVDTFFSAPDRANDYSLCTFELDSIVKWLYACHKSGALTEKETGLPLSQIGTREFLEILLHSIAYREGFGDILAEGLVRAVDRVSEYARSMVSQDVAPIGQFSHTPARAFIAYSLIYPMEPRVHQPLLHETAFLWTAWLMRQMQPDLTPVSTRVFREVARAFWGSEAAGDVSSYEGKVLAAKIIQNRTYLKDSLGLCDFAWPIMYSFNTADHVGDPELENRVFTAVTGIPADNLDRYAEVVFNLQRAILLKEGRKTPEADYPPEYNFTEPLRVDHFGRPLIIPGADQEVVNAIGKILDRDKFMSLLKEYYRLRGWDEDTGIPEAETLRALGMEDVATELKL